MSALLVGALLSGLVPGPARARPAAAASSPCGGETPAGSVRVAILVDYGTEAGAPGGPSSVCLTLPSGATGGDLLRERARTLGAALPRYAASGLLCGLDGWPGSGCGELSGGTYRYWAYWTGTSGSWVYGGGNPFTRRLRDGDIEGWRFTAGAGNGSDPPPSAAPDASALFPSAPDPGPGGGGDAEGGGNAGAAPGTGDNPGSMNHAIPADPAAPAVGDATAEAIDAQVESATATPPSTAAAVALPESSSAGDLAAGPSSSASSSGVSLGLIAGLVAIVALGAAAALRFRRRPDA